MIRFFNIIAFCLIIASAIALYQLKFETRQLQERADHLNRQIIEDQSGIRVLEAEWAYLSSPERLQELAGRYLALKPASPAQVMLTVSSISLRGDDAVTPLLVDEFQAPRPVVKPAPRLRMIDDLRQAQKIEPDLPALVQQASPVHKVADTRVAEAQQAKAVPREKEQHRQPFNPLTDQLRLISSDGGRQ